MTYKEKKADPRRFLFEHVQELEHHYKEIDALKVFPDGLAASRYIDALPPEQWARLALRRREDID